MTMEPDALREMGLEKVCRKCGRSLSLDYFSKDAHTRDGKKTRCRECVAAQAHDWYEQNKDAIRDVRKRRRKTYYAENRERLTEYNREYRVQHREELHEARSRKYAETKDENRERRYRWLDEDPRRLKAQNAVSHEIAAGRLIAHPCEVCGTLPTQAHHDDYSKPLEVRWLCTSHHLRLHAELRRKA